MKFTLAALTATLLAMAGSVTEARFASINVNLAMTVSEDSHQLSEDMVRICAQQTDISMEELHKLRQNDFSNSSEATQCFTHCIFEQMGLVRDGVFIKQDAIGTLADVTDPNKLMEGECMHISGANKCETAFKIYQCHQEHRMRGLPKESKAAQPAPSPMMKGNSNYNNNNGYNNNNRDRDINGYNNQPDMVE